MDKVFRLVGALFRTSTSTLLVAWAGALFAQNTSSMTLEQLNREVARIGKLPIEEQPTRMSKVFTQFTLDRIWPALQSVYRADARKPSIEIVESAQSPYLDGERIVIPSRFVIQINSLGMMLGHDVSVEHQEIEVKQPLLFRPIGASAIFSLLDKPETLLGDEGQLLGAASFAIALRCDQSASNCMQAQAIANLCGMAFVLAHESTHLLARDKPRTAGAYPIDEELFADSKAVDALRKFLAEFQKEEGIRESVSTTACLATPAAYFELWARQTSPGQTGADFKRRRVAYLAQVPHSERVRIERLLTQRTSKRGLAIATMTWETEPQLLVVDGIRITARDVKARQLLLPEGEHTIFAGWADGFSFREFRIRANLDTHVSLLKRPTDDTELSTTELRELRADKKWFSLFLATTDKQLRPKNLDYAALHWDALRELKLGAWIDPASAGRISSGARKRATEWANESLPLVTWDEMHAVSTR